MNQFIRYTCVGLALLVGTGQALRAQPKNAGFDTLETASEASVKTKAAAWLKDMGKNDAATMQRFEALWSQRDRTMLDRLAETFALGDAAAAKLLAESRNSQVVPSITVPEVLAKEGQPFFRANLALAYARNLAGRLRPVYDEGLDALKLFTPEQVVEPASYLFHRAVCEHALLMKVETNKSVRRLLEDAIDCPDRFKTVSLLMILDMQNWRDKDLNAVAQKMEVIGRRLDLAKAGSKTQKMQKEVVLRLEELIKEEENKAKKQQKDSDGEPKDGPPKDKKPGNSPAPECPEPGPGDSGEGEGPGSGQEPKNDKATDPLKDSKLPGGAGDGRVDLAELKKLQESWKDMPARERDRQLERLTEGMSPSHREAIVEYFRNINALRK